METGLQNRASGSVYVPKARRVVPKGDRQAGISVYSEPATYHFRPIPGGANLGFTIAVAPSDEAYRQPQTPPAAERGRNIYHRLDLYLLSGLRSDIAVRGWA